MFLGPLSAHHGTSAFDMDTLTTVKGTVTKFEFMNPHALIYVDVAGNKGEIEHWIAEESSNNHLSRSGWDKNTLKMGDQVTVAGHRARNGARVSGAPMLGMFGDGSARKSLAIPIDSWLVLRFGRSPRMIAVFSFIRVDSRPVGRRSFSKCAIILDEFSSGAGSGIRLLSRSARPDCRVSREQQRPALRPPRWTSLEFGKRTCPASSGPLIPLRRTFPP